MEHRRPLQHRLVALGVVSLLGWIVLASDADARGPSCPSGMALVSQASLPAETAPDNPLPDYCIDRYEGSLIEITPSGERPFSPYETVQGRRVRAVSRAGVVPQAYISRNEADLACKASHKRLCKEAEWTAACKGKRPTTFPYGDDRKPGYCNDSGVPPLATYYPGSPDAFGPVPMNDPRLNALAGTVSHTGQHTHCKSSWGTYDMVGNVHEWIEDPAGTFLGGYYLDTHINGDGCGYKTVAHDASYHDYSTGFRCCKDAGGR
jgi:hypothetical protein